MAAIDLPTVLSLVGTLDDSTEPGSASVRFRNYLCDNVGDSNTLRAYVDACLVNRGDQYNRALQDLINRCGSLLGFEVTYGRYRGVAGEIGFDGLWQSPTGWAAVVEAKTTDVYTVRTATLLGYINELVSAGRIEDQAKTLGLYVYGRFDAGTGQLENTIVAEGRQDQLRVISVDALLNLLELRQEYKLEHEAILQFLLPSPVRVDRVVDLVFSIVSQEKAEAGEVSIIQETRPYYEAVREMGNYYLLPANDSEDGTPVLENLHRWLDRGLWGLGQRTGYRRQFQPGDRFCFYAARIGVVVSAQATTVAFELDPAENPGRVDVPYGIRLTDVHWFEDSPIELTDGTIRAKLSAFQGRDPSRSWAWFVQGTKKLTRADFELLTRSQRS